MKVGPKSSFAKRRAKKLIPSAEEFRSNGDRMDKAENKVKVLTLAAENGANIRELIKQGKVNRDTLREYLADGAFSERLESIRQELSGAIVAVQVDKAANGDNDSAKFILPALNHSFDAGIRREEARAKTAFGLEVFKQLLNPAPQRPDNADYVTLEAPDWSDVIGFDPSPPDGPSLTEAPIRPVVSESDKGDTKV